MCTCCTGGMGHSAADNGEHSSGPLQARPLGVFVESLSDAGIVYVYLYQNTHLMGPRQMREHDWYPSGYSKTGGGVSYRYMS